MTSEERAEHVGDRYNLADEAPMVLSLPVSAFGDLSTRAINRLRSMGIRTAEELLKSDEKLIRAIGGVGRKSLAQIDDLKQEIHRRARMPIAPPKISPWLSRSLQDPAALRPLLQGLPLGAMQAWPVARTVNRGTAEGAGLIVPVAAPAG